MCLPWPGAGSVRLRQAAAHSLICAVDDDERYFLVDHPRLSCAASLHEGGGAPGAEQGGNSAAVVGEQLVQCRLRFACTIVEPGRWTGVRKVRGREGSCSQSAEHGMDDTEVGKSGRKRQQLMGNV